MDYKKRGLYRFMLVQRFKTYNIYYDNKKMKYFRNKHM
jgi:hypothetical protein